MTNKTNERDYHAKLVVNNIDGMTLMAYQSLIEWLQLKVEELKEAKRGQLSEVYTAKLMK